MRQYIALIHKDPDSDYGVSFPDLPGCVTAGVDLDDARRMAEEALALHLAGMAEDDEPIPEPSSLEAIMAERENRDAVAILVKAPAATAKAIRVNMTIPGDELEEIDKFAAEQGYTRSGFLLHGAKMAMATEEAAKANTASTKGDELEHLAAIKEALEKALSVLEAMAIGDEKQLTAIIDALKERGWGPMVKVGIAEETIKAGLISAMLLRAIEARPRRRSAQRPPAEARE